jgi:preprotein translocase subunit SecF
LHDIVLVTAMFVVFGRLWQVPLDSLFVSAMLAIAGYSVNDTIVIFSRLKEDWVSRRQRTDLAVMLDRAARATLTRSLNTALATLMTLVALFVFGGLSIRWFVVALGAGIVIGTYSSIFVAGPFLYILTRGFGYGGRR